MNAMWLFVLNSILLGAGLAMDAFSVSIANGLSEPGMNRAKASAIAGVYGGFQFLMPVLGWIFVTTVVGLFSVIKVLIPYIALGLLLFIGIKMIVECIRGKDEEVTRKLTLPVLLMQGVATSIDALSVGFTIAEYKWHTALLSALIIGAVTFVICLAGLYIGKRFGRVFRHAEIAGGIILIAIGIEIFIKNVFFA